MSQTETEFAKTFLFLLSTTTNSTTSALQRPRSKHHTRLLPKFPPLPVSKKPFTDSSAPNDSLVKVILKSIKTPRFNLSLSANANDSVYKLKAKLLKAEGLPAGVKAVSQLKFLIKGKVIQDSVLLSSITNGDDELIFTVLVSEFKAEEQQLPVDDDEPETPSLNEIQKDVTPEDEDWELVHSVLTKNNVRADVLARLHKGWELTK